MSEIQKDEETVTVSIGAWVDKAKADPKAYVERQATEIFLTALGKLEPYGHQIFLKGGVLMGVLYGSPRQTGDVDLTAIIEPKEGIAEEIAAALDAVFPGVAADLGYADLMCKVQTFKYFPKGEAFPKNEGPAIKMKVGYARRGTKQQQNLDGGRASDVLEIDISFREPVGAIQIILFEDTGGKVGAYSLLDLMTEKLRALLQQEKRNRFRRQDIYDLNALLVGFTLESDEKAALLALLHKKCVARGIAATIGSLSERNIVERARRDWHTMEIEIGDLPDFDECFERVDGFYKSLPWDSP